MLYLFIFHTVGLADLLHPSSAPDFKKCDEDNHFSAFIPPFPVFEITSRAALQM